MARTVIVFRDTMIERERLAASQTEASRAQEQRSDTIALTIAQFKHSVESALSKLRAAAMKLEMSSTDLNKAADTVSAEAAHRRAARRRRIRQRHHGRQLGRGTGGLDRRNRLAGREIDRRRGARGVGSPAHRHHHVGTWQCRYPHRRGGGADPGDRRADQSAGAQRHHRGRARRRIRQGLRGRRVRGEIAGRPDRQGDRGDRRADRLDPVGGCRRRAGDRAGQRHHPRNVVDRHDGRGHRRSAEFGGGLDRGRRQPRLGRGAQSAPRR